MAESKNINHVTVMDAVNIINNIVTMQRIPSFLTLGERQKTPTNKIIIHTSGMKKVLFNGKLRDMTDNDVVGELINTVPCIDYYKLKTI